MLKNASPEPENMGEMAFYVGLEAHGGGQEGGEGCGERREYKIKNLHRIAI